MPAATNAGKVRPRQPEAARPVSAPPAHRRLALALILTAAFMVVLDSSIAALRSQTRHASVRL
jgi:hypothetical protein